MKSLLPNKKVVHEEKPFQNGVKKRPLHYQVVAFNFTDAFVRRVVCLKWWENDRKRSTVLRVPANEQTGTCRGAIAMTFTMKTDEYNPSLEG